MHMDALTHSPLMQLRQEASVKAAKAGEKDGTSAGTQFLVVRCCKIRTNIWIAWVWTRVYST